MLQVARPIPVWPSGWHAPGRLGRFSACAGLPRARLRKDWCPVVVGSFVWATLVSSFSVGVTLLAVSMNLFARALVVFVFFAATVRVVFCP